jgi:hypothetical protein
MRVFVASASPWPRNQGPNRRAFRLQKPERPRARPRGSANDGNAVRTSTRTRGSYVPRDHVRDSGLREIDGYSRFASASFGGGNRSLGNELCPFTPNTDIPCNAEMLVNLSSLEGAAFSWFVLLIHDSYCSAFNAEYFSVYMASAILRRADSTIC